MIIMKGAGEKSFCAGGDIVDVTKQAKKENYLAGLDWIHNTVLIHLSGHVGQDFSVNMSG